MSILTRTFSESWHRVAEVKASLRPTVKSRLQKFRGERWYVLHDPFNNQFFRLRPAAYNFVARLRPDRTVEEVWREVLEHDPDGAPGQEEVIRLLTQLHFANLLYYDTPADSEQFFERYRKRKQRELKSRLLTIMFMRIPLLDPDNFLRRLVPYVGFLFGKLGFLTWLLVLGLAGKVAIDNFDALTDQAQGVLAPDNLILLYLGMVFIKTLHEFGHALICRYYGGEVHTMGVMLLVFTPLPYMDATSSWAFRSRWQRALVGAGGMIVELFVAALATFVWANTGPGVVNSLAYNMMFIASVSTLVFNANPLLKFDGYYILSDLLDLPNLYTRARKQWAYLFERYVFGVKEAESQAETRKEYFWLLVYGALSGIYRVIVFAGIIIFVADKYLLLGLLMVIILVISWVIVPPYKLIKYLASSPRLARTRSRAVGATVGMVALVVLLTAVVPFPNRFRAPGVVEAETYVQVVNDAPGWLTEVLVESGREVGAGTPLLRLSNPELDSEMKMVRAQWRQVLVMEQWANSEQVSDREPIRKRKAAIAARMAELERQRAALVVKAKQPGVWVAPRIGDHVGTWQLRGTRLGQIVDERRFRFTAVVPQDEASRLFAGSIEKAEVRLFGQAGVNIGVSRYEIIPFESDQLPSAALSWLAGGEVATARDDDTGRRTTEPFFQINADLVPNGEARLLHGRSGKLRLSLHDEPLLWQWERALRQLLQKRYQI